MNNNLFRRLAIGGVLCWLLLFGLLPNLMLGGASFFTRSPVTFLSFPLTLENYRRLLDPVFLQILVNSLILAGLSTLLCLLVGYPFAYIAARASKQNASLLLLFVMIPFWTNSLIRTYALIALLKANGLLNGLLIGIGLISEPLRLMYTPVAIFIGLAYTLLPFMILPLYSSLQRIDFHLIETARDLGATPSRAFMQITIPLTMPGILAGCTLVFVPALGMFYIPDILGGARQMMIGNYIRDQFLTSRNLPLGAASSVALTLLMALLLLLYYYSIRHAGKENAL